MSEQRPLNVCMFSNLFPPTVSGSSLQASRLARELVAQGCDVTIITGRLERAWEEREVVDGVHVHRLPALRLPQLDLWLNANFLSLTYTPANIRRVQAILQQRPPDVLHLHNHMFDLALMAVRMRRKLGAPLALTIHTIIKHSRKLYDVPLVFLDRQVVKRAVVRRTDALITPDSNAGLYATEAFQAGEQVVIPYGVELPGRSTPALIEELKTRYKLHGRRVLLSLGHVHAQRDRGDIIDALPKVLRAFPDAVLLVVGGVFSDLPAARAKRAGVGDSVIFTGALPHSEVPALLELCDLETHWLTQDVPERTSLGIASLEAMAAGRVVVAAAKADNYGPGVLVPGENIVMVEPGRPDALADVMIELLGDGARRALIGGRARATIERVFSWESVTRQTIALYRQLIARRAVAP